MLRRDQCSKDFFDKARRMARYSSGYIEKCLIEQDDVNAEDAAKIVGVAKKLGEMEGTRGCLSEPFSEAWRKSNYVSESVEDTLVKKFSVSPEVAATITSLAKRLDDLDVDLSNINAVDPMAGFS